jgi:hypothetical protein
MAFLEWQKEMCTDTVRYYIQEAVPTDRWDHCQPKCISSIHSMALMKMKMGLEAPMNTYDVALREYAQQLFDAWDKIRDENKYIAINMNGGHHNIFPYEVLEVKEYTPTKFIFELGKSPHMIIENDFDVDEWYTENVPTGFSYITDLGKCSFDDLKQCFKKFNRKHPDGTLWIHTQALDKSAFTIWVMTARAAGIYKFKIHPSVSYAMINMAGTIERLKELGARVDILE